MKSGEIRRDLEYLRVGRSEPAMYVLHETTACSPRMSCNASPAFIEHRSDLEKFDHPSNKGSVRLSNVKAVLFIEHPPFILGCEAFSSRDRHARRTAQLGIRPRIGIM